MYALGCILFLYKLGAQRRTCSQVNPPSFSPQTAGQYEKQTTKNRGTEFFCQCPRL